VQNAEIDSLPLMQTFKFALEQGVDNNFIYLKSNWFGSLSINPFLNAKRYADIDMGNCPVYKVHSTYKLPSGYSVELVPKNTQISLFDQSIVFKRLADLNDNVLTISYSVVFTSSTYKAASYPALHDFYRKMFELLDEPVVLKKM
jgi:hypothetical protein